MLCALFLGFVVSKKMGAQKKMGKSKRKKKELSRSSIRGSPLKYHYSQKKKRAYYTLQRPRPKEGEQEGGSARVEGNDDDEEGLFAPMMILLKRVFVIGNTSTHTQEGVLFLSFFFRCVSVVAGRKMCGHLQ